MKTEKINGKITLVFLQYLIIEGNDCVKVKEKFFQNGYSKWLEGLILLIILLFIIFMAAHAQPKYQTIQDQTVSKWSGTIDNLE